MSLLAVVALLTGQAHAQSWPLPGDWSPVPGPTGAPLVDPAGDYGGGKIVFDIVGTDPDWAGFVDDDGVNFSFRVRLADNPQQSATKWESFNFFVALETDNNAGTSFDHIVYLDGNSDLVRLAENTTPDASWCNDSPEADVFTYAAPPDLTGYATVSTAGTTLGGANDYFLDIQLPVADLLAATGQPDTSTIRFIYATSSNSSNLNKDIGAANCTDPWPAAIDPDPDGDGLTDRDEIDLHGTDPLDADTGTPPRSLETPRR